MTRTEYLEIKAKRDKLKSQLSDFELGFKPFDEEKLYDKWQKWEKLPEATKQAIRAKCEVYYEAVEAGYFGQKRREAVKLLKAGETAKLKALVAEVKVHPSEIQMPSSIDPDELERKMWPYFTAKSKISKWEALIEQYAPLYESKRSLQNMDL